jgi:polysaccharide export outer membrane protein
MAPVARDLEAINLAQLASTSVRSDLIDRGDLLEVTVMTDYDKEPPEPAMVRVDESGRIGIPPIGDVLVAGLSPENAQGAIIRAAIQHEIFYAPRVTVKVEEKQVNRVTVIGPVAEPGNYEIPRANCSLVSAIMEAGGLTEEAGAEVRIRRPAQLGSLSAGFPGDAVRAAEAGGVSLASYETAGGGGPETILVDLIDATENHRGYYLNDGDIVEVGRQAVRLIRVSGLVNKPAEYEIPPGKDIYVLDALSMAGGRTLEIADRVMVIRRVAGQEEPVRVPVSVYEAKRNGKANLRLAANDLVTVEETPATMALSTLKTFFRVSVGGSLASFGLF